MESALLSRGLVRVAAQRSATLRSRAKPLTPPLPLAALQARLAPAPPARSCSPAACPARRRSVRCAVAEAAEAPAADAEAHAEPAATAAPPAAADDAAPAAAAPRRERSYTISKAGSPAAKPPSAGGATRAPRPPPSLSLDDLVIGNVYKGTVVRAHSTRGARRGCRRRRPSHDSLSLSLARSLPPAPPRRSRRPRRPTSRRSARSSTSAAKRPASRTSPASRRVACDSRPLCDAHTREPPVPLSALIRPSL